MSTEEILALLVAERNRLDAAIRELQGPQKITQPRASTVRTAAAPARKRMLSDAARKAMAEAAKRRWAAVRAGKSAAAQPGRRTTKHAA